MMQRTVLLVDDDAHIREVVRYALEKEELKVIEAENGLTGLAQVKQHQPDMIILDIMMPEMNGLDMCREVRKTMHTPILFLSSRDDEIDKIIGLEMGGDDYVTKPFSPRELIARIKVILRRLEQAERLVGHSASEQKALLCYGQLSLNTDTYRVYWNDVPVILTSTEFSLLQTFLAAPERVYTRDALIQADIFKDIISDRTIDSHIRRLRQKFTDAGCANIIETVHGFGYKLSAALPC